MDVGHPKEEEFKYKIITNLMEFYSDWKKLEKFD